MAGVQSVAALIPNIVRLTKNETDARIILFCIIMGRKRKIIGLTLDLTRIPENGEFILEDLIVIDPPPLPPAIKHEFPEWLTELYKNPCTFCGIIAENMHFDHINMFEKTESVSALAYRGCSKEEILAEIGKCQLLCVSCHQKVTNKEHNLGFIRTKRILNTSIRRGDDVEELRNKLKQKYSDIMTGFYAGLARDLGESVRVGVEALKLVSKNSPLTVKFIWGS